MIKDVIILCLDKRKPLWQDLTRECQKRGWSVHQYVVGDGHDHDLRYNQIDKPGVPDSWRWGTGIGAQHHFWAFESHKGIIKHAIKKKLPSVLLLEDDAQILPRYNSVMDRLIDQIDFNYTDLLYLGWHCFEFSGDYAVGRNIEIENVWNQNQQCKLMPVKFNVGGFHAVWINSSIYTQLVNLPAICPMDSQVNRMIHLNRYLIAPKIFHTRNTFSYCENREVVREVL